MFQLLTESSLSLSYEVECRRLWKAQRVHTFFPAIGSGFVSCAEAGFDVDVGAETPAEELFKKPAGTVS